jgi:CRP-like cAMP-binding protein
MVPVAAARAPLARVSSTMPDSESLTRPSPLRLPCANHLLQLLSAEDAGLVPTALESMQLDVGRVLYAPGQPVRHVYFVESGLVSIVGANKGRRRMEVGMVGFEGMTSLEVVLGGDVAAHEALVQSSGSALRLSSAALRDAIRQSRSLHDILLRFVHAFMVQGSHAAIAAGRARIDERLSRGLLMWHDRIRDAELFVTHEFLALLMGVRRQGVTVALHELEGKGLIRSVRNRVRIIDRAGLERTANGFYGVPEDEYRRLFGEDLRHHQAA